MLAKIRFVAGNQILQGCRRTSSNHTVSPLSNQAALPEVSQIEEGVLRPLVFRDEPAGFFDFGDDEQSN